MTSAASGTTNNTTVPPNAQNEPMAVLYKPASFDKNSCTCCKKTQEITLVALIGIAALTTIVILGALSHALRAELFQATHVVARSLNIAKYASIVLAGSGVLIGGLFLSVNL